MDKSLKKIKKSRFPKWNPNDWQIDDGKARVRIKGRHWDDVSVPHWVRNCDTDRFGSKSNVSEMMSMRISFQTPVGAGHH